MKLLICCLVIIVNITNNIKASIESIVPTNVNILLEDTTKNADKSCYRPCKFNVKPRRCKYNFKVVPSIQENGRQVISINGVSPGPPIHACVNDVILVEVHNKIPDQDIAIHWHGVEQRGTPYMDGVPMVTQCPIGYGSKYKYAFRASTPGTFYYHSDSVTHQSDGVFGALIVNQPQPLEANSNLYDYDRSLENTLLISASFPQLLTASLDNLSLLKPNSLKINGEDSNSKIVVLPGFAYRLRLINAIAVDCPVVVNIDRHELVILASDAKPVKPASARKVKLYPGERMDVVVRATQDGGGYWLKLFGEGACEELSAKAMFLYSGFNYTSMLVQEEETNLNAKPESEAVYGQMLEALHDASYNPNIKTIYLGIDRNVVKANDNDYRYLSDAMKKKPFFPSSLVTRENGVVQINGKSFLYPNTPILLNPHDVHSQSMCDVGEEDVKEDTQCIQVLNAVKGEVLELALVNEGFGSNESYTFHMHGYSMQVVATWENPNKNPISKDEFYKMDKEDKIIRNLQNPVLKDTVTVPNKGFTIVRINLDHDGSWMLECKSCGLFSLPTAVIVNVPQPIPTSVVDSLPKCGNYRPPDVLLN